MSIQEYISNKRKIQSAILSFIDDDDDNEEETERKHNEIITLITSTTIHKDKEELKQIILIISNISDNHHRSANFFDKIGRIIEIIKEDLKNNFSNAELFTFFRNNKRTLLLLVEKNILTINEELFKNDLLLKDIDKREIKDIKKYFSPELGNFEKSGFSESIDKFKEYRDKGQNESYICELIRQDSVVEFIRHVNMSNISLSSEINDSIFETNSFLINKRPLTVQYAAFYGSIQIFQYIKMNKPDILNGNLWVYAIHSNKSGMIHALEENGISPNDQTYEECLIESIKCHHNEIADYISNSLLDKSEWNEDKTEFELNRSPVLYHNFELMPDDFEGVFKLIFYLMQNEYSPLVKLINDQTQFFIDINDYEMLKHDKSILFSESFVVQQKSTSRKFMIKSYNFTDYTDELSRMMMCRYPPILDIKGFSPVDLVNVDCATILTNYYEMTLNDYINEKKTKNYSKTNDYIIILGITIGLRHLYKNGIINEYLNPDSIYLDENLYPIIDNVEFSSSWISMFFLNADNGLGHTFSYRAPEQTERCGSQTSNVFSYAFILYYLITLNRPFPKRTPAFRLFREILNSCRPDLQFIEDNVICEFLERCWCHEPHERFTFDEIFDIITQEIFYSYFEPLDRQKVIEYLDIYGNEFDEIKKKFE